MSFVFTHTESLPETFDHISDSLLSSLQSHVKDWWGRWWTKINQSHSHSHRQPDRQALSSEQKQAHVLSGPVSSLLERRGSCWSEAACCPLLSTSWLHLIHFVLMWKKKPTNLHIWNKNPPPSPPFNVNLSIKKNLIQFAVQFYFCDFRLNR